MVIETSTIVNPIFNDRIYVLQFQELWRSFGDTITAFSNVFGHAKHPALTAVWSSVFLLGEILSLGDQKTKGGREENFESYMDFFWEKMA
jgi:hypothetical protein